MHRKCDLKRKGKFSGIIKKSLKLLWQATANYLSFDVDAAKVIPVLYTCHKQRKHTDSNVTA